MNLANTPEYGDEASRRGPLLVSPPQTLGPVLTNDRPWRAVSSEQSGIRALKPVAVVQGYLTSSSESLPAPHEYALIGNRTTTSNVNMRNRTQIIFCDANQTLVSFHVSLRLTEVLRVQNLDARLKSG
jgi:hypothetical protein